MTPHVPPWLCHPLCLHHTGNNSLSSGLQGLSVDGIQTSEVTRARLGNTCGSMWDRGRLERAGRDGSPPTPNAALIFSLQSLLLNPQLQGQSPEFTRVDPIILNIYKTTGFPLTLLIPGTSEGMSHGWKTQANTAMGARSQTKSAGNMFHCYNFSWKKRGWMLAQAGIPLHWEQLMKTLILKKCFVTEPSSPAACQEGWHAHPELLAADVKGQQGWRFRVACLRGSQRATEVWISPALCSRLPPSIPSCTSCSLFALKGQSLLPGKAFPPWQGFHEADGGETQEPEVSPHAKRSSTSSLLLKEYVPPPCQQQSPNFFSSLFFQLNRFHLPAPAWRVIAEQSIGQNLLGLGKDCGVHLLPPLLCPWMSFLPPQQHLGNRRFVLIRARDEMRKRHCQGTGLIRLGAAIKEGIAHQLQD